MNATDLKKLTESIAKKVSAEFKAKGITVNNLEQAARAMSLQPGMVLHPICKGADDILTGDPIDGVDAQGNKQVNGFAYIDTQEGVRLTESQISRLGNGLKLQGKTKVERFAFFAATCMEHPEIEVAVKTKYTNVLSNGQTQGLPVFSCNLL